MAFPLQWATVRHRIRLASVHVTLFICAKAVTMKKEQKRERGRETLQRVGFPTCRFVDYFNSSIVPVHTVSFCFNFSSLDTVHFSFLFYLFLCDALLQIVMSSKKHFQIGQARLCVCLSVFFFLHRHQVVLIFSAT